MGKASGVFAALAALLSTVDSLGLRQPAATISVDYALDGITPKPTFAANFHEALRRAASSSIQTAFIAPDNTCGFISGLAGAGYTCGGGGTCVFYTSSTAPGHVACCNTVECNIRLKCIDSTQFFSQSKCDNGCAVDTFTLKCTSSELPFCNTLSFPGGITDVFCNTINIAGIQAASTTFIGQTSRTFTPLALTGTGTGTGSIAAAASTSATGGSSSIGSSSTADPTETGNENGGSNGNNGDDKGNTNGGSGSSSKTPVGPIVGGVVGGVAALGLLGLLFFFIRRKKQPQAQTEQTPPAHQSPPVQQSHPNYYDHKLAAATPQPFQPPNQQYAQHAGYYPPPNPPLSPDYQNGMSAGSHMDSRMSQGPMSASPSPSGGYVPPVAGAFQPQEGAIHEAPANPDHHHGQMHELA